MDKPQIQIKLEKEDDMQVVEKILDAVAEKFGLVDNAVTSCVPNTIRSFAEEIGSGFGLGARVVESLILVDFNPRCGRTDKFNLVFEDIASKLQKIFEERFSFAKADNYIKTESSLPLSEAGRKFNSQIFSKLRAV
ncbi:MAG TPA: hypothetical protein VK769_07405 [Verrucomicrobiae bacterium]|jgi:hypothetical protein|nr:hypothetical protein [Verrucomicrobiae bacterium]